MTPESALLGRIADDYAEIAALRARAAQLEQENQQLRAALASDRDDTTQS